MGRFFRSILSDSEPSCTFNKNIFPQVRMGDVSKYTLDNGIFISFHILLLFMKIKLTRTLSKDVSTTFYKNKKYDK